MIVEYSGWDEEKGFFYEEYRVRESGLVIIENQKRYRQLEAFQVIEKDWNNDGDVYTLYVALFEGPFRPVYYTGEDLVSFIVDNEAEVEGVVRIKRRKMG